VPKHNAHHAWPNQIDRDPDIGVGPIAFAFTPEAATNANGSTRFLARYQAWLFFPLLAIEGIGLHITGIHHIVHKRNRAAAVEGLLLAVIWPCT